MNPAPDVAWFVDAWAVRDGAAFASLRRPSLPVGEEAVNTVFLCVPDLEPVPVGRRSTALSATRRHFQDGLRDEDGENEIAFSTVEQVADLVRRGFLGGGLGPDAGVPAGPPGGEEGDADGTAAAPAPGPEPPGSEGGATAGAVHYETAIRDRGAAHWPWIDGHVAATRLRELASIYDARARGRDSPEDEMYVLLSRLVVAYAEAVTIDWEARVRDRRGRGLPLDERDVKALGDWYDLQTWIGTIPNPVAFTERHKLEVGWDCFAADVGWAGVAPARPPGRVWISPAASLLDVVHEAPCPRRRDWIPGLARLQDKVALPLCLRAYYRGNAELAELAPGLLAALVLNARRVPSFAGDPRWDTRMAVALRWLADQQPIPLPEDAERALERYVYAQLGIRHPEPPPPAGPGAAPWA